MEQKEAIRELLQRLLEQKGDRRPFSDSDSLLLGGRLQSVDAVDVVIFLEEKFGIDFAAVGFDESQIDSVDAILALIQNAGVAR
jgi:acyl carrier protein